MKTRFILTIALLLTSARAFADMDIVTESIYDVLSDKISGDAGNMKDPEYLKKLINAVAEGTSDQMVQEIVDNYDPASVASEIGMKLLEKLVPSAAGPLGLMMDTSAFVHEKVRDWLDWAKANRMEEFKTRVIDRGGSVAELDAAWNNFNSDFIQTGLSDTGVLYAERPDLLREMKTAYAMRRKELLIEEQKKKAVTAKAEAKQRAVKHFNWMRKEARMKVEGVVSMLKLTGQPATRENVRKALKDPAAYNDLVKKWWTEVDKTADAKGAVKTPVSGDPDLDKAVAIVAVSKQPIPENSVPDYGPVLRDYGQNADRLLSNNISPEEYSQVNSALWQAAENMNNACVRPLLAKMSTSAPDYKKHYNDLYDACVKANQAYRKETAAIDSRLTDYAGALKSDLAALTMGGPGTASKANTPLADFVAKLRGEFYGSPAGKKLESADWLSEQLENKNSYDSHQHWAGIDWSGKENQPLEKLKSFRNKFSDAALTYEILVPLAAEKSAQLLARLQQFENDYNKTSVRYAELYQQNSSLAQNYGIPSYDFKVQAKDMETARAELANPKSFANAAYMGILRDGGATMRREQAAWDGTLGLNEQFMTQFRTAPEEMGKLLRGPGGKAPAELNWNDLNKYFEENYADFLENFLQGALILLDEKTQAQYQDEAKPYGNGYKKVLEIADTPAYASLKEHNKRLEEFRKKLEELKLMDLEGRKAKAEALAAGIEGALKKIPVPSKEAAETAAAFAQLKGKLGGNITSCGYYINKENPCLSYPALDGKFRAYEAKIRKAEEYEKNTAAACLRSQSDLSYDYRMDTAALTSSRKWIPSEETSRACGAALKARTAASEKEFRKYTPFEEVTIAGRALAGGSLELKRAELAGGRAIVRGSLHPDAPAYAQVYVSLNGDYARREPGQTVPVSGGSFEYSFAAVPGETYYVGVQAIGGPGGMVSQTLPSNGHMTLSVAADGQSGAVQAFYDKFKAAYEGRSAPAVMALISPDWTTSDGTTVTDLEENLRSDFRLYDEIRFSISGLKVTGKGNAQEACYDTVITSRLFKRNLKHEEKAAVCDELKEEGGKLKITRTLSGKYWYIK